MLRVFAVDLCYDWGICCVFVQLLLVYNFSFFFFKSIALCVVVFLPLRGPQSGSLTQYSSSSPTLLRRSMQILPVVSFLSVTRPQGEAAAATCLSLKTPPEVQCLSLFQLGHLANDQERLLTHSIRLCPVYCKYYWWLHHADEVARNFWSLQNVCRF